MQQIDYEKTLFMKSPYLRLSDVLEDLPDNVYLNKTITGCGGTHLSLTNSVNYVVIVPFKSAIYNKTNPKTGGKGIISVMQGVSVEDITEAINRDVENNKTVKIMTTYDSFYKVHEALVQLGMVQDFKLCIDEAHVLTTLAKIKGKSFNFLYKVFRDYKAFTFLTATPNDKSLIPTAIRDVDFVRVVWESAEKVKITEQRVKSLAECNKYVIEICKQHLLGEVDGNAYIYYNSVNEIISVIKKLKLMEDFTSDNVNIFCSENPYNDKKVSLHLGKGYLNGNFSDNKKINFLTSANYESCDIMDLEGRTYIIVSSKRNSTALTNHLAVVQACGRLRKSVYKNEAKMIICGFSNDTYLLEYDDFVATLKEKERTAQHLIERATDSKERGFDSAYSKDLDSFATNPFIIVNDDNTIEFNEGAMLAELQVYKAFNSYVVSLPNAEVGHTVRVIDDNMLIVSDEARLLVDEKVDFSRIMKSYIQAIKDDDIGKAEMIADKSEIHRVVVEELGIDRVESIGLNKTKIMNAYNLSVKFSASNEQVKALLKGVSVGNKYTSSTLIHKLQYAYDKLGLERKAVSNDIKNYFVVQKTQVVSEDDGKRKQGFLIVSDLYKD